MIRFTANGSKPYPIIEVVDVKIIPNMLISYKNDSPLSCCFEFEVLLGIDSISSISIMKTTRNTQILPSKDCSLKIFGIEKIKRKDNSVYHQFNAAFTCTTLTAANPVNNTEDPCVRMPQNLDTAVIENYDLSKIQNAIHDIFLHYPAPEKQSEDKKRFFEGWVEKFFIEIPTDLTNANNSFHDSKRICAGICKVLDNLTDLIMQPLKKTITEDLKAPPVTENTTRPAAEEILPATETVTAVHRPKRRRRK